MSSQSTAAPDGALCSSRHCQRNISGLFKALEFSGDPPPSPSLDASIIGKGSPPRPPPGAPLCEGRGQEGETVGRGPREKLQASGSSMCLSNLLFSQGQKDRDRADPGETPTVYTQPWHRMHSLLYSCTNARRSLSPHFRDEATEASGESVLSPRARSQHVADGSSSQPRPSPCPWTVSYPVVWSCSFVS